MANYKSMFLQYMDSKDIKYTELDEFGVGIVVGGENIDAIRVLVIFEEDGIYRLSYKQLSCVQKMIPDINLIGQYDNENDGNIFVKWTDILNVTDASNGVAQSA